MLNLNITLLTLSKHSSAALDLIGDKDIVIDKINVTARLKFPSIENFIELIPKQTPPRVRIFGRRYLVFFEVTNLNFLFGSIIQMQ